MKYAILLALLVCAVIAQNVEPDVEIDEPIKIEESVDPANYVRLNLMNRMRYSAMNNPMAQMSQPPQQAVDYYSNIKDDEFPVDYSLSCSNTCGCRQYCVTFWWMMCNCMCPPPCPVVTTTTESIARFPPIEWNPNPIPPRLPLPRLTTQAPSWNPRPPQPNPWNPWNPPMWNDPNNPNNHLTHPPNTRATTALPWNQRPPIWGPEPWDPNNPKNHLTHPPRATTPSPNWRPWPPQQPQFPQWPQPEPIQPDTPWWQQPQLPQQPQQPQFPQWPQPEPIQPDTPWWQQPQLPQQPQFPQWPQPEPIQPDTPWWQQNQQQPQPLPEMIQPDWQRPNRPEVPEFPLWNQPPITDWLPPQQPIEDPCDNACSCTPCSIIWICPVQCSTSCCAARRFGDAERVDEIDAQAEALINFELPNYLKDVFIPGLV